MTEQLKPANKPKVRIERVLLDQVISDNCVVLAIGKEKIKCVRVLNVQRVKCSMTSNDLYGKDAFVPIRGATKRNLVIDADLIDKVMEEKD